MLVVAALVERRGRILLAQRRHDQSFPLSWEFPGGKVEAGETPEAALVREIEEELGLCVTVGEVVEVVRHAYPEFELVMPVFRATIVSGVPRALQVAAFAWVPRRRLLSLSMPPADRPLAEKLARGGQAALDLRVDAGKSARRVLPRRWNPHKKQSRRLPRKPG